MSTAVMNDATTMIPATDSQINISTELHLAKCDCCGLTEECTPAYIQNIRERYHGNWMCGLCGEAVNDEITKTGSVISTKEAMTRHMNFCRETTSSSGSPSVDLIEVMRQILRRRLDSPRALRSMPSSPLRSSGSVRLSRSESCLTDLTGGSCSSSYMDLQDLMK